MDTSVMEVLDQTRSSCAPRVAGALVRGLSLPIVMGLAKRAFIVYQDL